jgi:ribosomal-protein-alanine N-acetyltransferase
MTVAKAPRLDPMRWWHVEAVMAIETEAFGPTAWTAETYWSELAQAQTRWYVVARDEPDGDRDRDSEQSPAVLGYAGLMVQAPEADVQTIAVSPAARGRGLGRQLLRALIEEARRRGASSLLLEVRADNQPAIALYESEGFERLAVRRAYYQPGDIDAWVMRRRQL